MIATSFRAWSFNIKINRAIGTGEPHFRNLTHTSGMQLNNLTNSHALKDVAIISLPLTGINREHQSLVFVYRLQTTKKPSMRVTVFIRRLGKL